MVHDVWLDGGKPWRIEKFLSRSGVFKLNAQIIAFVRIVTVRRVGGSLAS